MQNAKAERGSLPKVSAVLLNYARPYHLAPIVRSLDRHEFIDEILIWDNSDDGLCPDSMAGTRADISYFAWKENVGTLGRWYAASHAQNETIYTQDDDVIVNRVPELLERFQSHRSKITAGLAPRHFLLEAERKKEPWIQIGWGSLHLKSWLDCIATWIEIFGVDDLLKSKFDRIYTTLFGNHDPVCFREHVDFERLRGPDGRDSDRDSSALWKQPDHYQKRDEAVRMALTLRREACPL